MNAAMIKILSIMATMVVLFSCGVKKSIPESLQNVKSVVECLDSAVTSMYGWEPQDSTYNKSVDTLVAGIMNQYNEDKPDYIPSNPSAPAVTQGAYNQARKTWVEFKYLVDSDKYEEALDYYFVDSAGGDGKNAGDFLVFLKHSTYRYTFDSEVLLPMMRELRGDTFAVEQYIDILHLEKAMEDASIAMNQRDEPYIPEVYPYVVKDLGFALASKGNLEEALNLSGDLISAIYDITGSAIYSNFFGTQYGAQLFEAEDDIKTAIGLWENFERYLEEYKDDYSPEELSDMKTRIDREKQALANKR
jgi:hypothetical protein